MIVAAVFDSRKPLNVQEVHPMNKIFSALLLLFLAVAQAWGAGQPDVKVQLTASRIVKSAQGKESIVSGESAKPGEIIEYRAVYKNSGTAAARSMAATLPELSWDASRRDFICCASSTWRLRLMQPQPSM